MNAREQLLTSMTSRELVQAMAETSHRIKACRADLDVGRLILHSRWMDAMLDEWLRRSRAHLERAS